MHNISIILYDSRSGSTFLSSALNQYESIEVALESGFPRLLLELRIPIDMKLSPAEIDECLTILFREKQFKDLGITKDILLEKLKNKNAVTLKVIFDEILQCYFGELKLDKHYLLKIPIAYNFLDGLKVFLGEDYKIIHLIRDSRGVFNSKKRSVSLKGSVFEKNLLAAALGWKKKIKKSRVINLPRIDILYEDLILDIDIEIERIMNFLEIPNDCRKKTKSITAFADKISNEQRKFHENVGGKVLTQNIGKWEKELSDTDILISQWINHTFFQHYGYKIKPFSFSKRPMLFMKASVKVLYYMFDYIFSRSKNVFNYMINGELKTIINRKLYQ